MILIRYFDRDYTAEQIDRAEEMQFHPCRDGTNPIRGIRSPWKFSPADRPPHYDEKRHEFYYLGGGCSMSSSYMPRIGDGMDKKKGDPYPSHWLFDPFTGDFLRGFDRDFTAEELDRAEGMQFHPCDCEEGHSTALLHFGPGKDEYREGKWHYYDDIVGYDAEQRRFKAKHPSSRRRCQLFCRISEGKDVLRDEPYPEHWITDPFTGEWLKGEDAE
jgi:hypothetical protein